MAIIIDPETFEPILVEDEEDQPEIPLSDIDLPPLLESPEQIRQLPPTPLTGMQSLGEPPLPPAILEGPIRKVRRALQPKPVIQKEEIVGTPEPEPDIEEVKTQTQQSPMPSLPAGAAPTSITQSNQQDTGLATKSVIDSLMRGGYNFPSQKRLELPLETDATDPIKILAGKSDKQETPQSRGIRTSNEPDTITVPAHNFDPRKIEESALNILGFSPEDAEIFRQREGKEPFILRRAGTGKRIESPEELSGVINPVQYDAQQDQITLRIPKEERKRLADFLAERKKSLENAELAAPAILPEQVQLPKPLIELARIKEGFDSALPGSRLYNELVDQIPLVGLTRPSLEAGSVAGAENLTAKQAKELKKDIDAYYGYGAFPGRLAATLPAILAGPAAPYVAAGISGVQSLEAQLLSPKTEAERQAQKQLAREAAATDLLLQESGVPAGLGTVGSYIAPALKDAALSGAMFAAVPPVSAFTQRTLKPIEEAVASRFGDFAGKAVGTAGTLAEQVGVMPATNAAAEYVLTGRLPDNETLAKDALVNLLFHYVPRAANRLQKPRQLPEGTPEIPLVEQALSEPVIPTEKLTTPLDLLPETGIVPTVKPTARPRIITDLEPPNFIPPLLEDVGLQPKALPLELLPEASPAIGLTETEIPNAGLAELPPRQEAPSISQADKDALFGDIMTRYSKTIEKMARKYDPNNAEDLTQDALIKIYKGLDKYDPSQGDLPNFAMRTARNSMIDAVRGKGRTPVEQMFEEEPVNLRAETPTPEQQLVEVETARTIQDALSTLSPDQRAALQLRAQGDSYREIADQLGAKESTLKPRIFKARKKLKENLGMSEQVQPKLQEPTRGTEIRPGLFVENTGRGSSVQLVKPNGELLSIQTSKMRSDDIAAEIGEKYIESLAGDIDALPRTIRPQARQEALDYIETISRPLDRPEIVGVDSRGREIVIKPQLIGNKISYNAMIKTEAGYLPYKEIPANTYEGAIDNLSRNIPDGQAIDPRLAELRDTQLNEMRSYAESRVRDIVAPQSETPSPFAPLQGDTGATKEGGFLRLGQGQARAQASLPQNFFFNQIGKSLKRTVDNVGKLMRSSTFLDKFLASRDQNVMDDIGELYSPVEAKKVVNRTYEYERRLNKGLSDAAKETSAIFKEVKRLFPGNTYTLPNGKTVKGKKGDFIDALIYRGAQALEGFDAQGMPILNKRGQVYGTLNGRKGENFRDTYARDFNSGDSVLQGRPISDFNAEVINSNGSRQVLTSLSSVIQDPAGAKYRLFLKYKPGEAEAEFARAVTGDPNAVYDQTTMSKANPKLLEVLKKIDQIRKDVAAEQGIDPLEGYIHQFSDEKGVFGLNRRPYTAGPRKMREGVLFREGKTVLSAEKALAKMQQEFVREREVNTYIKDLVDILGSKDLAQAPKGLEDRFTKLQGETRLAEKLKNPKLASKLGLTPQVVQNLKDAGLDLQANGLLFPKLTAEMLKMEMMNATPSAFDSAIERYAAFNYLYALSQDLTNIGVLSKLGQAKSGVLDAITTFFGGGGSKLIEDIGIGVQKLGEGDAAPFAAAKGDIRAIGRSLARPIQALAGRDLPEYLTAEYLPEYIYKEESQARTNLLKGAVSLADKATFAKKIFDSAGKRFILDAYFQGKAEEFAASSVASIKDRKARNAAFAKAKEDFFRTLPNNPDVLAEGIQTANEFSFGGQNLNPYVKRFSNSLLTKSLVTAFPRWLFRINQFTNQRLNPLSSRNRKALFAPTSPDRVELGPLGKVTKAQALKAIKEEASRLPAQQQKSYISQQSANMQQRIYLMEQGKKADIAAQNTLERQKAVARLISGGVGVIAYMLSDFLGLESIEPRDPDEQKPYKFQREFSFQVPPALLDQAGYKPKREVRATVGGLSPYPEGAARLQLLESAGKNIFNTLPGVDPYELKDQIGIPEFAKQAGIGQGLLTDIAEAARGAETPSNRGKTIPELAGQALASSIPGAGYLKIARDYIDPYARETKGFAGPIINAFPTSTLLEPKRDKETGAIIPSTNTSALPPILRAISPIDLKEINATEEKAFGMPGAEAATVNKGDREYIDRWVEQRIGRKIKDAEWDKIKETVDRRLVEYQQKNYANLSSVIGNLIDQSDPRAVSEYAQLFAQADPITQKEIANRVRSLSRTDRDKVIADTINQIFGEGTMQYRAEIPQLVEAGSFVDAKAEAAVDKFRKTAKYKKMNPAKQDAAIQYIRGQFGGNEPTQPKIYKKK